MQIVSGPRTPLNHSRVNQTKPRSLAISVCGAVTSDRRRRRRRALPLSVAAPKARQHYLSSSFEHDPAFSLCINRKGAVQQDGRRQEDPEKDVEDRPPVSVVVPHAVCLDSVDAVLILVTSDR